MKIVMVTPFPLDPNCIMGGVASVSVYLTRQLNRIPDVEVEVVVPDTTAEKEYTSDFEGIPVHYLPRPSRSSAARLLWAIPQLIQQKLSELTFDLVHVQATAYWSYKLRCPYVLTIHGIPKLGALYDRRLARLRSYVLGFVEGLGHHRAKNIIAISPYVREQLGSNLRGEIWDIENPVADDFFDIERQPIPGRILYGGFISALKNIKQLIKVFSIVTNIRPNTELRIAGSGLDTKYGQQCKQLVTNLGLNQKVQFLGLLSVKELQAEMASAYCLALCSLQETAPVIIEEAMAAGLPVVASNICGIPYLVSDGATGKLVNPNNVMDIAKGLLSILDCGYANYKRMCRQANVIAEKRFRASVIARKTHDVYKTIIQNTASKQV